MTDGADSAGGGAGGSSPHAPLRVAVTGTPGTGKTTATDRLAEGADLTDATCEVVHLNDAIREEGLYEGEDPDRGSLVADVDALADWLDDQVADHSADRDEGVDAVVFESHLAHHFAADRVAVLRCAPEALEKRLADRGEDAEKASENAESEALDLILSEAVTAHGEERVYEIDTTDATVEDVAAALAAVVDGTREPSAGTVDFTGYL